MVCIISFFTGITASYYVFQGTCDDVDSSASWNLIAAWRSLHAASMNPTMAILSPQTTQAAGVAAASIITLGTGLVGMGLQKNNINVGNPMRFITECSTMGKQTLNGMDRVETTDAPTPKPRHVYSTAAGPHIRGPYTPGLLEPSL